MRAMDPLQVAMTGVRMGEKYLQVFCHDKTLTQGLAGKTGLSGVAALAAPDAAQAGRAKTAAAKAGVLIDIQQTPPAAWPWETGTFDMVVIDNTGGDFNALTESDREVLLRAVRRVVREGGRVELIERLRGDGGLSEKALQVAGLRPVRTLAEKDGFRFVEGLNA